MNTSILVSVLAASTIATAGCAVADGAGSGSSAISLVDQCSGSYTCYAGSKLVTSPTLQKQGDACMMNSTNELNADGSCTQSGGCSWTGDAKQFQVCESFGCFTCTLSTSSSADAGGSGGKCTGTPYDCGEESPPYCSQVRGCYMGTRLNYDNSFDDYCTGAANSCDEMSDEGSCNAQGCVWQQ